MNLDLINTSNRIGMPFQGQFLLACNVGIERAKSKAKSAFGNFVEILQTVLALSSIVSQWPASSILDIFAEPLRRK